MAKRKTNGGMDCSEYLAVIQKEFTAGNAAEHNHRPALKTILKSAAKAIVPTNEPKPNP